MNSSVASLFDTLANQLQLQLSQKYEEPVTVSQSAGNGVPPVNPMSWSWMMSIDWASRILVAAPIETWRELCNLSDDVSTEDLEIEIRSRLTPAIEETVKTRFGAEVTCTEEAGPESFPNDWASVEFVIRWESGREVAFHVAVNADLEAVLGAPDDVESQAVAQASWPNAGLNPVDILMDVEMPVSISLGRTRLRLKELLQVTSGSVVELDQDLSAEVEIRVNNHVIAYGEVVAVEGNYAVRIVRMAQPKNPGLRGILPERAA